MKNTSISRIGPDAQVRLASTGRLDGSQPLTRAVAFTVTATMDRFTLWPTRRLRCALSVAPSACAARYALSLTHHFNTEAAAMGTDLVRRIR